MPPRARMHGASPDDTDPKARSAIDAARQNIQHRSLGLYPDRVRRTPRFSRAGPSRDQADIQADRAVDGFDDLVHRCLRGHAAESTNPPAFPRHEAISSARDKACRTLDRKLSGAPWPRPVRAVARAPPRAAWPDESSPERHNRRRASVASTNCIFPWKPCPTSTAIPTPTAKLARSRSTFPRLPISAQSAEYPRQSQALVSSVTDPRLPNRIFFLFQLKLERNSPKCPARISSALPARRPLPAQRASDVASPMSRGVVCNQVIRK